MRKSPARSYVIQAECNLMHLSNFVERVSNSHFYFRTWWKHTFGILQMEGNLMHLSNSAERVTSSNFRFGAWTKYSIGIMQYRASELCPFLCYTSGKKTNGKMHLSTFVKRASSSHFYLWTWREHSTVGQNQVILRHKKNSLSHEWGS